MSNIRRYHDAVTKARLSRAMRAMKSALEIAETELAALDGVALEDGQASRAREALRSYIGVVRHLTDETMPTYLP